jgi:hypothetical protein
VQAGPTHEREIQRLLAFPQSAKLAGFKEVMVKSDNAMLVGPECVAPNKLDRKERCATGRATPTVVYKGNNEYSQKNKKSTEE